MEFGTNKASIEVIKEQAFGGTYTSDIFAGVNDKRYRKSWKEFNELKNIDSKYYFSYYYKYGVKCVISLRFWENKSRIKSIGLYGWFQWYFKYWLGRRSYKDDRIIARWKEIVSIFKDKLVKMIKDVAGKFHDYSISSMIRQVLLHWD